MSRCLNSKKMALKEKETKAKGVRRRLCRKHCLGCHSVQLTFICREVVRSLDYKLDSPVVSILYFWIPELSMLSCFYCPLCGLDNPPQAFLANWWIRLSVHNAFFSLSADISATCPVLHIRMQAETFKRTTLALPSLPATKWSMGQSLSGSKNV